SATCRSRRNSGRAPERWSGCPSPARPRPSESRPAPTSLPCTARATAHPPHADSLLVPVEPDAPVSVELSRAYARGGHAVYVELVGCGHMEHLDPESDAGQLAGNWLEPLLAWGACDAVAVA